MSEYETRVVSMWVGPKEASLFHQVGFHVSIKGSGAGEFIVVRSNLPRKNDEFAIDVDQWPELRAAIQVMSEECRNENGVRYVDAAKTEEPGHCDQVPRRDADCDSELRSDIGRSADGDRGTDSLSGF